MFELPRDEDGRPPLATEGLWAVPVAPDVVRLDNTPWFVLGVASGDLIGVRQGEDDRLWADKRLHWSGHCTIRIVPFMDAPLSGSLKRTLDAFAPLGVTGEGIKQYGMVALDVPPDADVAAVRQLLQDGERDGWWDYEEGWVDCPVTLDAGGCPHRIRRSAGVRQGVWQAGRVDESAWPEVSAAAAAAPYRVKVLPAEPEKASACLAALEITTRSWLGVVVVNTGGLLVDHGWLRVLGCGHDRLPDVVAEADRQSGFLIVGYDVMGGQFAWLQRQPGVKPTVHYFGPDDLGWLDLEQGYAEWLNAMLAGSLTGFYESLRWPGWQTEVAALALDESISAWPPPFLVEVRTSPRFPAKPSRWRSYCRSTKTSRGSSARPELHMPAHLIDQNGQPPPRDRERKVLPEHH